MPFLLDDFTAPDAGLSARWSAFTDRVMGGVSTAQAAIAVVDGIQGLRLTGQVSLENNGGFVQVARTLGAGAGASLDASGYEGLALQVRGSGGPYFVHLRTADCRAPWQHYSAPLPLSEQWQALVIPWSAFIPVSLRARLAPSRLTRLGIVAAKAAFVADVAIAHVALVP